MKTLIWISILFFVGIIIYSVFQFRGSNSLDSKATLDGEQCIITILDEKYDVTELRTFHPGGNVYRCGDDMTTDFQNQHGNDLDRIEKYKVQ